MHGPTNVKKILVFILTFEFLWAGREIPQ